MATMNTPGVYIVEKNAFSNSVVEVATAVPAFIGYTRIADNRGVPLKNHPFRISSMAEFVTYFGGPPTPLFDIVEAPPSAPPQHVTPAATAKAAADAAKVVDAKKALAVKAATAAQTAAELAKTAAATAATTDTPENQAAAEKAFADASSLETAAAEAYAAINAPAPVTAQAGTEPEVFAVGADGRKQGYALTASATEKSILYYSMRHFFQNGGGPCYIVSVGTFGTPDLNELLGGIKALERELEPTMVVIPDAILLEADACNTLQQAMLAHCGETMKNRVAILDIHDGDKKTSDPAGDPIKAFRGSLGVNNLKFGAAYYPWVRTTIVQDRDLDFENFSTTGVKVVDLLQKYLPDVALKALVNVVADVNRTPAQWDAEWNGDAASRGTYDDPVAAKKAWIAIRKDQANQALMRSSDLYVALVKAAVRQLNLLPPSAAMAGVYTMVDNTRGVWKAPANVSLNSVVAPAVSISAVEQEDLNVTPTGKSINAIRSFIGEGVLVWGARTLDGNSLDWRYINVRRTMIMLEESCRLAAKATVFEPNVAGTWTTIRSMIQNFLTGIWKRGGLAGATPEDAFSVFVGLGETMTAEDILEGILRVTVLVAISRPAEFIEITFQQQMQKS